MSGGAVSNQCISERGEIYKLTGTTFKKAIIEENFVADKIYFSLLLVR